jgi:FAD/FMN-containing dehydrogenase
MRERVLKAIAASFVLLAGTPALSQSKATGQIVNDVHSRLNETRVARIVTPRSVEDVQKIVQQAGKEGRAISIAGGRHAMGGQQFGADTILLDTSRLNRALAFDEKAGLLKVQAGIRWPALLEYLERSQKGKWPQWGIRQKQTGADRLSIGGALAANAHGRGLRFKPMIADVESFTLVDAQGKVLTCSRTQNPELFRLAIGGYGLFGVITDVKLRLMRRTKVQRSVQVIDLADLVPMVEKRIADGYLYGDFQFNIDPQSERFLTHGVFSTYKPVDHTTPIPRQQKQLQMSDWSKLFYLAHTDKKRAFDEYANYYLSTNGQIYWSDTHQLAEYLDNYHVGLDKLLAPEGQGTEMITEVYVPREAVLGFMQDVGKDLRAHKADVIYGTIRFIEPDDESYLPWARSRFASIIFNLHTAHTPGALDKTAEDFRGLIARALQYGGSYYLTYHRWATRTQVEQAYPQFPAFLREKRKFDPDERFQSDWYRFYKRMFADVLPQR